MSLMTQLLSQFQEEVEGVKEYSTCATAAKDDPALHKMYLDMAQTEYQHAQMINAQIAKQASAEITPEEAVKVLEEIWKERQTAMVDDLCKAKAYLDSVK